MIEHFPANSATGAVAGRPLAAQVAPLVEYAAQLLPGVTEAWVRDDGREFVLIGPAWDDELSMAASGLAVALQLAFDPEFTALFEGAFEEPGGPKRTNFRQVFRR